jgi:hypothetical protein
MSESGDGGARDLGPRGESLRQALRWLGDHVRDAKDADRLKLVQEAALRFDLTPADEEFLIANWVRGGR